MYCYIWYSEEGPWRAADLPSPLLAVPHVTAHPSTVSVLIIYIYIYIYDGPLLCGFTVALKELIHTPIPNVTSVPAGY